ncbi:2-hydroxyacid dehydrogenase [Rubrimonas sp.]|uniref:2-hydroxyacid dehydrogenase n=1 Tax=Rubrimonas sp. TaxID=2036015 RepID=UPI002FDDED61
MDVAVFSTQVYDQQTFEAANPRFGHSLTFFESRLSRETRELANGFPAICAFVNDVLDREVLTALRDGGARMIALRCAGFNNLDLEAARELGIAVSRVPAYSPFAVAEHTVGLILALNRRIHRAYNRVRESNFALNGLMGFDLRGRTAGIVGTGRIGRQVAQALKGFDMELLGYDVFENPDCVAMGMRYVPLDELLAQSDVISLHCPLTPDTHHMINPRSVALMKPGAMLINTGRGALVDAQAAIDGLKSGRIGHLGLDVYEQEENLFFHDHSNEVLQDDAFGRLLTFPNVLVTGHQAFFTREALDEIAETTLDSVAQFEAGGAAALPEARRVVV